MTEPGPPPRRASLMGEITTVKVASVISAVVLAGFAAYALRRILEPFALAVFLLILIDGMARALRARVRGLGDGAAIAVAMVFIVAVVVVTIWLTADNAADIASGSSAYAARIDTVLGQAAQRLGLGAGPTIETLIRHANPARYAGAMARALGRFAEALVFVLVYLGFLVASRGGFAGKTASLFPGETARAEARRIFERVRLGVERYIWVQTVVGVIITGLSAVLMAATGLSHIPFWCLIIFLANYIPAIGAAVGVLFPAVFGLVEFDGLWRAAILLAGLEAVHFAVSHIIQPRMQGRSLNLDPIVVLLALAFWSVVWGVTGALLSTPLTVIAMALLAEFPGARPLAVLLSSDGKPFVDLKEG